jgi:hypothetical protein
MTMVRFVVEANMTSVKSSTKSYRVETISIMLLLLSISALLLSQFIDVGWVTRSEFSPDKLSFRSRAYFCHTVFESSEEWSAPLLDRIRAFDDGRIPAQEPPRWDFMRGEKWRVRGWNGDARLVNRVVSRSDEWLDWTDKNPELANRFWPRVIHLLRNQQYRQFELATSLAHDAKTVADIDQAFVEAEKINHH